MPSIFFNEKGSLKKGAEKEDEGGGVVSIANKEDFGADTKIQKVIDQMPKEFRSTHSVKKFACAPEKEGDNELTCESLGDFKAREHAPSDVYPFINPTTFLTNVVSRYSDLDYLRVKTDSVEISDGELIL